MVVESSKRKKLLPMAPLNILIFEPYPMSNEGGNLRTQSYILEFIDKTKFNPIVLAPFESQFTNRIRENGTKCIVIKPPRRVLRYGGECLQDNFGGRLLTMVDMVRYNISLIPVIKEKNIDVIYSNCIRAVLSIGLAAKLTQTPHIWYIKGVLENALLDFIGFVLADKILFFCESNKHDKYPKLVKKYEQKIDILKIGINPETIIETEKKDKAQLKKELFIDNQSINVIYLGQLYAPKGVHYLLEATGRISKEFPNLKLYIVGDHVIDEYKEYKRELDEIIEHYTLHKNVVFTGWRTDALDILSLMDILVHPSLAEGFGRAVLEAMAFGKPVVASRVGGLREIINNGENGFLVEPGNRMEIAKKLSILLRDKELRIKFGKAARKKVFSEYLIQDKIVQLEQIWSKMVSRGTNF